MTRKAKQTSIDRSELVAEAWRRGILTYKLHAGQRVIYDRMASLPRNVRQACFICGRRFGKSYLTVVLAIEACLRRPGTRILVCAPFIKQATEISGPLMAKVTADAPDGILKQHRSSNRWNFANGSTLILSGLDLVSERIRGQEFDGIFLEESGSAAPEQFLYTLNFVLLPTLLKSGGRIIHVTTYSRLEDHPLHTSIVPKVDEQGALFLFPTTESPLYSKQALDEMCAEVGGPDSLAWRLEFLCQQVRDSSLVAVPEFDGSQVVPFELPERRNFWIAGDWGGVRDRTAFLLMTYDFARAKTLVVDERAFDNQTPTSEVVQAVRAMEEHWGLPQTVSRWVDAPGQLRVDLAREFDFSVMLPRKDDFEAGLNLVRMNLAKTEIHPRCEFLIRTLRYARLNRARTDFERTEGLGHADALAALVYGIRHTNRDNPYPAHFGLHSETHYLRPASSEADSNAIALQRAFRPDYRQ